MCNPDRLTGSVVDIEHLRDFSWLAITSSIEGNYPELVLTTSLQTSDHEPGAPDFGLLGLKNKSMEFLSLLLSTDLSTGPWISDDFLLP